MKDPEDARKELDKSLDEMFKEDMKTTNRIVAPAVIFGTDIWIGKEGESFSDIIDRRLDRGIVESFEMGFIDSMGQFRSKKSAKATAIESGQAMHDGYEELETEDLW